MAEQSTTRPNALASTTPMPAHAKDGASDRSFGSTASMASKDDDVDELAATVAGDFMSPDAGNAAAQAAALAIPRASEASMITRVIPVGTPSHADDAVMVGGATDGAPTIGNGDSAGSKKAHAQTLAGLAPPPELFAAAEAAQQAAKSNTAVAPRPPSTAPPPRVTPASKLPLPPPRPGSAPANPRATPPPPSASFRPPGSAPGLAVPPRPGASPPRMGLQPPPLPPAVSVPALGHPPASTSPGFVHRPPNSPGRSSTAMPAVTPPPPLNLRQTSNAMPAIAPPPVPGSFRRTSNAMPAIAPPPVPGGFRQTSNAMPAIAPPPVPGGFRQTSNAMPAIAPPPVPNDPRRTSNAMPAVASASHPNDPREPSSAMPAAAGAVAPENVRLGSGTIPMVNVAQSSSPAPTANQEPAEQHPANPSPPKMIYAPGTVVAGKYRLERVLGQGGMGAVWVVRNLSLDADFALKLIRRDRATEEAAARLLTEAKAAAKLGHPGIVRVFDFGQTEVGDPYLVMELLTGDSLGALIARKKRLEPAVAVQMLLPVAAALSAAHAKGIVHRDLKPDNILLATEDSSRKLVPKVLDFGIARVLRDDVERHQTMAGEVLGSPDYMSPEQARGQLDVDHRTDIWTFSVLLYESITGKRPFDGHNYNALIASIVSNPPMPVHAYGITDTELSGIIDRGLSKSPTTRWQTMRDMGIALAQWAIEHGVQNDISGVSIQTEWLASAPQRLLTLQPAQLPRVTVPGAEPQGANSTAPVVARDAAEWSAFRSEGRKKWLIGALVLVAFVGAFIIVSSMGSMFSDSSTPASNVDASPAPPTSGSVIPPEPVKSAPAPIASEVPSSQPSARASASSKTPVVPPHTTFRRKAPPVPTNIKF